MSFPMNAKRELDHIGNRGLTRPEVTKTLTSVAKDKIPWVSNTSVCSRAGSSSMTHKASLPPRGDISLNALIQQPEPWDWQAACLKFEEKILATLRMRRILILKFRKTWVRTQMGDSLKISKNLAHSSDRRGLQTVKEDEILCSLIRTAHEIHYRWNQWRMNGNELRWKCSCSGRCENTTVDWQKQW